ncbi:MAG: tetratricopeptide repeat protein [Porphyromonadaceae bacterium]|nr:MAG: tetratricopeptide repeat protein [Porphyromonadaceae bacterium]
MKAKILALAIGWMAMAGGLMAQNTDKMGSDPDACAKYQSLYQEFYKQGNFKDAMPWWKLAIQICPRYSKNLYIHGVKMFEDKIKEETDPKKQFVLVDSLLWVYDLRIVNFGNDARAPKGYILGLKGIAMQEYRKEDYPLGYKILGESIRLMGSQSSAAVVLIYMQASQQLFKDGAIDAEKVLSDYETVMDIVDANLKLNPDDENFKRTKEGVEIFFTNSGAATCEALKKLYTAKFAALKDDIDWLKKVTKQLKKAGCTDSRIFSESAEALFDLQPTAEAAHNIAILFYRREESDKAAEYLQKGIDIGQQSEELADMYYELATLNYSKYKNYQKARSLALKAIEARPNWGKPYLLIGQVYIAARQEVFSDPWDQATVFWVAVDKFIKAKSVDPEIADEANNLINTYSDYFPNNEMVFFRTMHDGDNYTVGGWINESTKVRSKKL